MVWEHRILSIPSTSVRRGSTCTNSCTHIFFLCLARCNALPHYGNMISSLLVLCYSTIICASAGTEIDEITELLSLHFLRTHEYVLTTWARHIYDLFCSRDNCFEATRLALKALRWTHKIISTFNWRAPLKLAIARSAHASLARLRFT